MSSGENPMIFARGQALRSLRTTSGPIVSAFSSQMMSQWWRLQASRARSALRVVSGRGTLQPRKNRRF
jgi:hypothetical protein